MPRSGCAWAIVFVLVCAIGCSDSSRRSGAGDGAASCAGMNFDCMDDGVAVSCCDSKLVTGGTFPMGRCGWKNDGCADAYDGDKDEMPEHDATVPDFRLDSFEVTVGRFRTFVDAYSAGWRPREGQGAHPMIAGSGWQSDWDRSLPIDGPALTTSLNCDLDYQTWTDAPRAGEQRPISCVDWYQAFAFCAWDEGRLPTEAEWECAAAGGSENRLYPWGSTGPINTHAVVGFCLHDRVAGCSAADVPDVGSMPLGLGRYGHNDLAGSMWEWTLDWYNDTWYSGGGSSCTSCSNIETGTLRVQRGGSWTAIEAGELVRVALRSSADPGERNRGGGFRCARGVSE